MSNSKLNTRGPFLAAEQVSVGAAAETLAVAGATIPQGAGNIWVFCPSGDSLHWHPTGTPTSTVGHAVAASQWFVLTHAQHGAKIISDDAGDISLILCYERGAGRQDAAYSQTAPF